MNKYLPSKKFILIFFSIILALGIIYFVSFYGKFKATEVKLSVADNKTKMQQFMALDSDKDGLKDWEEALWKTDPKNPDTDGDGTPDGDEVNLGRDPLKANTASKGQTPNDYIDPKIIAADKKAEEDYSKLSSTDKLSRNLFSDYLATKKMGTTLSTADTENIVNNFVANLPDPSYTQYTLKSITTMSITDATSVKNYGNQVAEIILKNLNTQTGDVYTIISDYSSSEADVAPTEPLEALAPIIAKNQSTVDALLKVKVPLEMTNLHLNLINAFSKTVQDLTTIKNAPTDMVSTLVVLNQYDTNTTNLSNTLIALTQYIFSSRFSIQYATGDFGYQLFNGILMKK